jgi:hypothetical protein
MFGDGDHVNWVLVIILVALALLLALVSTSGYGSTPPADREAAIPDRQIQAIEWAAQQRKELRTASETWYIVRALYQAGRVAESRELFDAVVAVYSYDPAARVWAGMAAFRCGDRAAAIRRWNALWCDEAPVMECGVWPAVALAAAELESRRPLEAARYIVPLERGDCGREVFEHPIASFYAALVYEQLATMAPKYRDAVEESLAEKFSPALASRKAGFQSASDNHQSWQAPGLPHVASDVSQMLSPNSQSWLIFLAKRSLERTIRAARSLDWDAPVVPASATVEPSFAPTVGELLESLGSADFAAQARRKLRALELYESPPNRTPEFFDDPMWMKRGRFIA